METMTLRQRATLVEALSSSLTHGGTALGTVPKALRRLLEEGAWREFVTSRGEHVQHERFADFVTTRPLKGLGSDVDLVRRIVADDTEAFDLLDQALQNPVGSHRDSDNITISDTAGGRGASRQYALRRLRKDSPELHSDVLAGRLSAHAAMVQAGFRPKTLSVPVTRPEAVAKALLKYMSAEDIAKLIAVLLGKDGGLCHGSGSTISSRSTAR
jgi:hypothetical protein